VLEQLPSGAGVKCVKVTCVAALKDQVPGRSEIASTSDIRSRRMLGLPHPIACAQPK
jgi:hypothetical protein